MCIRDRCYSLVPQFWGDMSESQYRFAEFQLDCASFELRRQGRGQKSDRISLERIPMELLILLLERQGSVVTREDTDVITGAAGSVAVSYTHLDVYKRQLTWR